MGNNYGMDSRRILAPSGLTKPENMNFLVIVSIFWGVQKKSMIPSLLIYNKFRYHTHKIRLETLVPLNYRFPTGTKNASKQIDQTVFKP